jgi:hypothetical protein
MHKLLISMTYFKVGKIFSFSRSIFSRSRAERHSLQTCNPVADATEHLQSKGRFESLVAEFETAKLVHEKMDGLIRPGTRNRYDSYLENRTEIRDWRDSEYADLVVVVKRSNHTSS